jgi:hypothetical protein
MNKENLCPYAVTSAPHFEPQYQYCNEKTCAYKEQMEEKSVRFAGSFACEIIAYRERVINNANGILL